MYLVFISRITVFLFVTVRFYTFGIGPEACPNLVQGVAGAGKGQAHFIAEDERMPVKVNGIFREDAETGMLQGTETYPWDMLCGFVLGRGRCG